MRPETQDCALLPLGLKLTQQPCQLLARFLSAFGRIFLPIPSLSELCRPSDKVRTE